MEDVTDAAFRRLIARYGKPDVMFTEFTSADGLVLAPPSGQKILRKKLAFDESERPVVAQLFSAMPERMEKAAELITELGFDGLDINMGCPVDEVVKSGAGAALINDHELARELVRAADRGLRSAGRRMPISIKTRIGYRENELASWLPVLLEVEPAMVAIHARTRNEMSAVPARWDTVKEAVHIRDRLGSKTFIVGNGDVRDISHARERIKESGADGVMLGRAIYGNPWLYSGRTDAPSPKERINALLEHLSLFEELMQGTTNYATMKKHFKAYISGWPACRDEHGAGRDGAKDLRVRLMETEAISQAREILTGDVE
ncbi:MAG: tRNA-dihydrouridine synthase [Parcubacteria group bacterium Gr01-1014_8]|nr:MAG: tRNA-dihydrouridine synthase [Parcubacteria group bacterium Gr01-1014_8]